ncbi:cytochrome ubiquinol oxidase subunit I [Cupriavidus gilardii]|uniref:Cytochrome ubiquinol oxidase subunit I n=1 Tax=Cupriavidus gilardii TaxID=82541 RepID=A0A849BBG8_9BURK|nr:cytochrome ubiquinol oxidase subunit I [Cupriavidus gilardii]KAB0596502.1 cytochrome ubiquinol oxidase subunit I [Cupriavidus gilardii]MCT9016542.1 cytochrome ubiquinol oxidase subunit I [Cupriavidus gilardii]MCT9053035.1 cytochrome ubiquinol oxidase subunit I [Cupriavidus gilardii]NNH09957.1 cytochrome ubiquinol oxidase subunit I [Cupriavidus gilardii]WNG67134.1 cytochrome ubiquinol oxidase subunit I [Cupriavidus gilardii]
MLSSLDPILLARIQFAANITFHILFPTISIALGWVLLFFKLRYGKTGDERWMAAYRFWVKVFALTFALGVVSGITMSFQFGTNWPGYMETVGNIAGPLLAYEVLTAFFLEATFLGIMLFGMRRVSNRTHTIATLLVAGGTTLSAFWILALNSWMQTPAGFEMIDGKAHVVSWLQVIFNPSFPFRLTHMLIASGLTVSFLLAGISAYRWLRNDRSPEVRSTMRTGVMVAAVLIPLQIVVGDLHGLNTLEHQPAKIAAMEGIWTTGTSVPAVLFGWPNAVTQSTDWEISIPKLASFYLTHTFDGEVKGIDAFPGKHPPVAPVFFAFRIMVGVGMLMLLVSWLAAWQFRRRGEPSRGVARMLLAMTFSGWVALVAGWYVTEIGRQPYLVYGVLTTAEAASKVPATMVGSTLVMYLSLYLLLIAAYVSVVFYLARRAGTDPAIDEPEIETPQPVIGGKPRSAQ